MTTSESHLAHLDAVPCGKCGTQYRDHADAGHMFHPDHSRSRRRKAAQ